MTNRAQQRANKKRYKMANPADVIIDQAQQITDLRQYLNQLQGQLQQAQQKIAETEGKEAPKPINVPDAARPAPRKRSPK